MNDAEVTGGSDARLSERLFERVFGRNLAIRSQEQELMDSPDLSAHEYRAVMDDLAKVNRLTGTVRPTLEFLERAVGSRSSFRLLDVGFGEGAMLRAIARWARERRIACELVGVDLNPSGVPAARAATDPNDPIAYRTGDYVDCGDWDVIISSLVAHHMGHGELLRFLRYMEAHAEVAWFSSDLHRHPVAYVGFLALSKVMRWHPIVCHDGGLSIARSYTPREWRALVDEAGVREAVVYRAVPFRVCVEHIR